MLIARHIEVFDVLRLQRDGKAFDCDNFHECLTLPLPSNRDLATVGRLLFQGILARDFIPFPKPSVDRNRVTSSRNVSEDIVSSFIGPGIELLLLVRFVHEQDVRIRNRFPGI